MRSDQYIGLNAWAYNRVNATRAVTRTGKKFDAATGKFLGSFTETVKEPVLKREVIGQIWGAWTDKVADLHRYHLGHGRYFDEYVQAAPWSSGPCFFVALKNERGNVVTQSLYPQSQIDAA